MWRGGGEGEGVEGRGGGRGCVVKRLAMSRTSEDVYYLLQETWTCAMPPHELLLPFLIIFSVLLKLAFQLLHLNEHNKHHMIS